MFQITYQQSRSSSKHSCIENKDLKRLSCCRHGNTSSHSGGLLRMFQITYQQSRSSSKHSCIENKDLKRLSCCRHGNTSSHSGGLLGMFQITHQQSRSSNNNKAYKPIQSIKTRRKCYYDLFGVSSILPRTK
jgi:hypothetical protein